MTRTTLEAAASRLLETARRITLPTELATDLFNRDLAVVQHRDARALEVALESRLGEDVAELRDAVAAFNAGRARAAARAGAGERPLVDVHVTHYGALGIPEGDDVHRGLTDDDVLRLVRRELDCSTPLDRVEVTFVRRHPLAAS